MVDPLTHWTQLVVAVMTSVFASSGLWAFIAKRGEKHSASMQLILGLAHERLVEIGMRHIRRGWITHDEYEDYIKYLYAPYSTFGGNGLAERIMKEVSNLPIRTQSPVRAMLEERAQEYGDPNKPYGD